MSKLAIRIMLPAAAAVILSLLSVGAFAIGDDAPPDCQCRAPDGGRLDLGTVTCVTIGSRQVLLRCEMSTNTPYWNELNDGIGCPTA